MGTRRLAYLAPAALLLAAASSSVARVAASPAALTFSTPQIVDPFREGFEPDISIDQHTGAMYSSVPNGTRGTSTL